MSATIPGMDSLTGFEVPPRSLDVRETVWGVDPSSKYIAVAVLQPAEPGDLNLKWGTIALSQSPHRAGRFSDALAQQLEFFDHIRSIAGGYDPDVIYIEEPFVPRDRREVPTHLLAYGVTLAALGRIVGQPRIVEIGPASWKAKSMGQGHGHAEKPEIMRWAQSIGYTGLIQDEADAIAIATAGAVFEAARARPIAA